MLLFKLLTVGVKSINFNHHILCLGLYKKETVLDFYFIVFAFSNTVQQPDIIYSEFNFMGCLDHEVIFSHTLHLDSPVTLSPFSLFCLQPSEAIK